MTREHEPEPPLLNEHEQNALAQMLYAAYARDEAANGPSCRVLRLNLVGESVGGVLILMVVLPDDEDCRVAQEELDVRARAAIRRLAPGHIPSVTRQTRWLG